MCLNYTQINGINNLYIQRCFYVQSIERQIGFYLFWMCFRRLFYFTRFAFSCIWEMNHNAEILTTRFTKSVINSKVKYHHKKQVHKKKFSVLI